MSSSNSNVPIPQFRPNDVDCTITAILVELKSQKSHMHDQDKILDRIEEQTRKTNGRVTRLEYEGRLDRSRLYTALAVLSAVGGFLQWFISTGLHKLIP